MSFVFPTSTIGGVGNKSVQAPKVSCRSLATSKSETNTIVFGETASQPSPGNAKGLLWLKNTTPSSLMFTNDTGTEVDVSSPTLESVLANGNDANDQDIIDVRQMTFEGNVRIGDGSLASGTDSISIGVNASCDGYNQTNGSVAIGSGSTASQAPVISYNACVAIGGQTNASYNGPRTGWNGCISIGSGDGGDAAHSQGYFAIAIGGGYGGQKGSHAYGAGAIAIGGGYGAAGAYAGYGGIAIGGGNNNITGTGASASGTNSIAIGVGYGNPGPVSSQNGSIAIGSGSADTGPVSSQIGSIAIGSGTADGVGAVATGRKSISIGVKSSATSTEAICLGYNASASGIANMAIGVDAAAGSNSNSVVIGHLASASVGNQLAINVSGTATTSLRTTFTLDGGTGAHNTDTDRLAVDIAGTTYYIRLYQ